MNLAFRVHRLARQEAVEQVTCSVQRFEQTAETGAVLERDLQHDRPGVPREHVLRERLLIERADHGNLVHPESFRVTQADVRHLGLAEFLLEDVVRGDLDVRAFEKHGVTDDPRVYFVLIHEGSSRRVTRHSAAPAPFGTRHRSVTGLNRGVGQMISR